MRRSPLVAATLLPALFEAFHERRLLRWTGLRAAGARLGVAVVAHRGELGLRRSDRVDDAADQDREADGPEPDHAAHGGEHDKGQAGHAGHDAGHDPTSAQYSRVRLLDP